MNPHPSHARIPAPPNRRHHCFVVIAISSLLMGAIVLPPPPARAQTTCTAPVGMNLTGVGDALVDVFKTSRAFWETDRNQWIWDTGVPLNLDENGYPTSLRPGYAARTLFMEALDGNYPTGTYTLLYDGTGHLIPDFDAINPVYFDNGGTDNRIEFQVMPSDVGIVIDITETDPADYVRNIRVIRPDEPGTNYLSTYQTQHFRPLLLERLRNYEVLRFMDWMGTNFSPVQSWSDRTLLSRKNWSSNFGEGAGMPYELLIELCNTTGAAPWFCMPHMADDQYVTEFATLVRDHLDPSLPIYVEYSNEVWNGLFVDNAWWTGQSGQNSYAYDQAAARGWDCGTCGFFEPWGRWVAQRSVEMFDLWNAAFGAQSDRLVRVLPIQNGPGNSTPWVLDHVVGGAPAYQQADVVAGAPYFAGEFGPGTPGIDTWSVDDLLDAMEATQFAFDGGPYWAGQTIALLDSPPYASAGLQYICYEGGQHLFNFFGAEADPVSQLFVAANRHPRMGELYTAYHDWWQTAGGGLCVLYTHTAYPTNGSFGMLEYLEQDTLTAPKWLATQDWIRDNCPMAPSSAPDPGALENPGTSNSPAWLRTVNPGKQEVTVVLGSSPVAAGSEGPVSYEVGLFDAGGRRLQASRGTHRPADAPTRLSFRNLTPGVYFVHVRFDAQTASATVVVLE